MATPSPNSSCSETGSGYISTVTRKLKKLRDAGGYWRDILTTNDEDPRPIKRPRRSLSASPRTRCNLVNIRSPSSPSSDIHPVTKKSNLSNVTTSSSTSQDVYMLLGVDNKVEYELLLSEKRCKSLCSCEMKDNVLSTSAAETISNFLEVSISVYQPDLFYLTMPLLVDAVRLARTSGWNLKIASEPPSAGKAPVRKRYGDGAVYEIIDSSSFLLRVIVELRTEQAACPLKSILKESHHAMMSRKAASILLVVAVATKSLDIKTAEVCLKEGRLNVNKFVQFSLTTARTNDLDRIEAGEFVWQLSQWMVENCERKDIM